MHCPSYTPDGHLFTGHHSSTSRGPKIFFCWCKKSQNGARELRALSPRFAQQQWLVGLVCVVQFTIPQRNKHCACHFIGVDEGNKFYLTLLSFNYTLFVSLLVCVALYITQSHDGGPKSGVQGLSRRFGFSDPSSGERWTQMAGILYSSHVYLLFSEWACPPLTPNHSMSLLLLFFKNKNYLL